VFMPKYHLVNSFCAKELRPRQKNRIFRECFK